jgi:hypothetical protein
MSRYPRFICRREDMFYDNWTYGDWRQYVCKRGDTTQCARHSQLPGAGMLIGIALLTIAAMGPLMWFNGTPADAIAWDRVTVVAVIGFVMTIVFGALWRSKKWNLMVPVGPMNKDGMRVFESDKEK